MLRTALIIGTRLKSSLSDARENVPNLERSGRLMPSIPNPWRANPNADEIKKNGYHGVTIQRVHPKTSAARPHQS